MSQRFTLASSNTPTLFLIVTLVVAGSMSAAASAGELLSRSPERGGIGLDLQQLQFNMEFSMSGRPRPRRGGLLNKLDERLSLIVTDEASTSAITFSDVMGQLADDKLELFRSWWDTANRGNPFCPETQELNGFPYECPRDEGEQAHVNPFDGSEPCYGYTAIAFVNRFDLADKDHGQHCGEFRIVFARNSGFDEHARAYKNCKHPLGKRLLINFEALVPNPEPPPSRQKPGPKDLFVNLEGCRPIVEFWLSLSNTDMTTAARGRALHDFFLKGLPKDSIARGLPRDDIGPIVNTHHYAGGPASGQIRTNQRMQADWTLREFKTDGGRIVPTTVKSNPGNSLFWYNPDKEEFADYLVRDDTLAKLRGVTSSTAGETNIDTFAFALEEPGVDHLNSFESQARLPDWGDVVQNFDDCQRNTTLCPETDVIKKKLTEKLDEVKSSLGPEVKSSLSAENIIHRIRTQTCAGCHHYSNGDTELGVDCPERWPSRLCEGQSGIWPSTLPEVEGFTHVSEEETEEGEDSKVFDLTPHEITLEELRKIRPERISHLDYRGPKGPNGKSTRYKISETLKYLLLPPRFENMVLYLNKFAAPH